MSVDVVRNELFAKICQEIQDNDGWWKLGRKLGLNDQQINEIIYRAFLVSAAVMDIDVGNDDETFLANCKYTFESAVEGSHLSKMAMN